MCFWFKKKVKVRKQLNFVFWKSIYVKVEKLSLIFLLISLEIMMLCTNDRESMFRFTGLFRLLWNLRKQLDWRFHWYWLLLHYMVRCFETYLWCGCHLVHLNIFNAHISYQYKFNIFLLKSTYLHVTIRSQNFFRNTENI